MPICIPFNFILDNELNQVFYEKLFLNVFFLNNSNL